MSRVKRLVKLNLESHPEGGYFKEMYRSDEKIAGEDEFPAGRSFGIARHVVPANSWFGVSVDQLDGYLLAGCTVAPGFDFRDFEMGDTHKLK